MGSLRSPRSRSSAVAGMSEVGEFLSERRGYSMKVLFVVKRSISGEKLVLASIAWRSWFKRCTRTSTRRSGALR